MCVWVGVVVFGGIRQGLGLGNVLGLGLVKGFRVAAGFENWF